MSNLFIRLFNMSITASWLILVILLLRLFFRKAPKAIRIILWSLVGLRLILPSNLAEEQRPYVIAHEQTHLARKDHLWKPLGFVLLAVYWFNPLIWVAYYLFCRDIELACDERVIRSMSASDKIAYSDALLENSVARRSIMACPLAFGAVSVKDRVRSILNYKKPAFWVIIAAIVVAIVLAVCFLTNPQTKRGDDPLAPSLEDDEVAQVTLSDEPSESTDDALPSELPEPEVPALKVGDRYTAVNPIYVDHFVKTELPLFQVVTPAYQGKIDRKLESLIHLYIVDLYQNKELGTTFDLNKYIAGESLASYLEKLISQQYPYIARSGFQRYNYLLGIEILELEELAEDATFVKLAVSLSYNSLGLDNYMSVGDIMNLIVSKHEGEYKVTDQYIVDGYYDTLLRGPDFNLRTEYLSRGIGSLSEQELSAKDQEVKDKTADFTQVVFPRYQSEELKDSVDETVKETVITFTGKLYENENFGQTHDLSPYLEGEILEVFLAEKIRFGQFISELAASKKFETGKYLPDAPDRLRDRSYEVVSKLHHLEQIENDIYLAEVQVISNTQYPDGEWGGSSVQVDLLLSITGSEVKVIDCYEPNDVFDVYLRGNIDLKFDYRRNRDIRHLRKIDILTKSVQLFGDYVD